MNDKLFKSILKQRNAYLSVHVSLITLIYNVQEKRKNVRNAYGYDAGYAKGREDALIEILQLLDEGQESVSTI